MRKVRFVSLLLADVAALLDLLKVKGVTRFTGNGVCVEFSPAQLPAASATATDDKDEQADPDTCRCGHSLTEHSSGLCLHACGVEKCAPEEN